MQSFYSHGKLLITGEYLVLDGAKALAVPTKFGQHLAVSPISEPIIKWKSLDDKQQTWFETTFSILDTDIILKDSENDISNRLLKILKAAKNLNSGFLNSGNGFEVISTLEFPRNWGLGSSSTLINNIAQWAKVDAFKLLELTFRGSGYDIACAQNDKPILYKLSTNSRLVEQMDFNPSFSNNLYFVHLNKKQDSREGISNYKKHRNNLGDAICQIDEITSKIITCDDLSAFNNLIDNHEEIISTIIKQDTVKNRLFSDFNGSIKSLGAWGGDFVLVSSLDNPTDYFKSKGYATILPYNEMILQ